jgi:hypothetical protein
VHIDASDSAAVQFARDAAPKDARAGSRTPRASVEMRTITYRFA